MRKILLLIAVIFAAVAFWKLGLKQPTKVVPQAKIQPTPIPPAVVAESRSLFVPYWDVPTDFSGENFDRLIYFGLAAGANGINEDEAGFTNLSAFVQAATGQKTYLTLRMLDTNTNLKLLEDQAAQAKLISEITDLAQQNGFEGIVLDLELSMIPLSDAQESVNQFVNSLHTQAHANNLKLLVATYGDSFYRKRPFDIPFIATHSDELLVMAYDFHKSFGEPGPNFPLSGRDQYGYDFKQMIDDYLAAAPPEKLTVVFGMYGYDWQVDEKKRPIKRATALPLNEIKKNFVDACKWQNCLIQPDAASGETEIDYVDSSATPYAANHIIWFEDERSMGLKKVYLKEKGIGKTALWVYGYF